MTPAVKPRRYDATNRRAAALERRRGPLLEVAEATFLQYGFAAVTIDAIAGASGVSTATIFKGYGGKAGLVRALCERALEGAGPVPAERRSDALRSTAADGRALIEGWGRLQAEVMPRLGPLLLLLREAAGVDTAAADLLAELDRARLDRMGDNARHLARAGLLRPGIGPRRAQDVLWLHTAPELFDLLVRQRGWSMRSYVRYVTDSMIAALL